MLLVFCPRLCALTFPPLQTELYSRKVRENEAREGCRSGWVLWHREAGLPPTADSFFPSATGPGKTVPLSFPKVTSTLRSRAGLVQWSRLSVYGVACLYACVCACLWKEARAGPDPTHSSFKTERSGVVGGGDSAESCRRKVPASCPTSSLTPGFHLTKFQSAWEIQAKISDTAQSPQKLEFLKLQWWRRVSSRRNTAGAPRPAPWSRHPAPGRGKDVSAL